MMGVMPSAISMPSCGAMAPDIAVAVALSELGNQVSESWEAPPKKIALLIEAINCPVRTIQKCWEPAVIFSVTCYIHS